MFRALHERDEQVQSKLQQELYAVDKKKSASKSFIFKRTININLLTHCIFKPDLEIHTDKIIVIKLIDCTN